MKVLVIGAGISGLVTAKICLDYGLDVVCMEKCEELGGHLRKYLLHNDHVTSSAIWDTSKEFIAFSDYLIPDHYPNFMTGYHLLQYLKSYVNEFEIKPVIKFGTEVNTVKRTDDFTTSGKWIVRSTNLRTSEPIEEIYDAVFLATGHHNWSAPYMPELKDMNKFRGPVCHSHNFSAKMDYVDRRVLVVDLDGCGSEVATKLNPVASEVYLSTNRCQLAAIRYEPWGLPYDIITSTRFFTRLNKHMPRVIGKALNIFIRFCQKRSTGKNIKIKPRIKSFDDHVVIFDDGSTETGIDGVILSSGYRLSFPCLEPGVVRIDSYNRPENLYQNIFPADLDCQTLFIMGLGQPSARVGPICELQARLCCEILLRRISLPEPDIMVTLTKEEYHKTKGHKSISDQRNHHIRHQDSIGYMDQLSVMTHMMPTIWIYIFYDPRLFFYLIFGPAVSYQYRLTGSHVWMEASEALVNIWDRVLCPVRNDHRVTTSIDHNGSSKSRKTYLNILFLMSVIFFILFYHFL